MKKLIRFFAVSLLGAILFVFIYSLPAGIACVFGRNFQAITQSEAYFVFYGIIIALPATIGLLTESFDSNFYAKK
jgi:hypothetical protein